MEIASNLYRYFEIPHEQWSLHTKLKPSRNPFVQFNFYRKFSYTYSRNIYMYLSRTIWDLCAGTVGGRWLPGRSTGPTHRTALESAESALPIHAYNTHPSIKQYLHMYMHNITHTMVMHSTEEVQNPCDRCVFEPSLLCMCVSPHMKVQNAHLPQPNPDLGRATPVPTQAHLYTSAKTILSKPNHLMATVSLVGLPMFFNKCTCEKIRKAWLIWWCDDDVSATITKSTRPS